MVDVPEEIAERLLPLWRLRRYHLQQFEISQPVRDMREYLVGIRRIQFEGVSHPVYGEVPVPVAYLIAKEQ